MREPYRHKFNLNINIIISSQNIESLMLTELVLDCVLWWSEEMLRCIALYQNRFVGGQQENGHRI